MDIACQLDMDNEGFTNAKKRKELQRQKRCEERAGVPTPLPMSEQ